MVALGGAQKDPFPPLKGFIKMKRLIAKEIDKVSVGKVRGDTWCHEQNNGHVKIRACELLCYNRVLCFNQQLQYTIICIIVPCSLELAS